MSLSYVVNPEATSVRVRTYVWRPTAMRVLVSDRAPFELCGMTITALTLLMVDFVLLFANQYLVRSTFFVECAV